MSAPREAHPGFGGRALCVLRVSRGVSSACLPIKNWESLELGACVPLMPCSLSLDVAQPLRGARETEKESSLGRNGWWWLVRRAPWGRAPAGMGREPGQGPSIVSEGLPPGPRSQSSPGKWPRPAPALCPGPEHRLPSQSRSVTRVLFSKGVSPTSLTNCKPRKGLNRPRGMTPPLSTLHGHWTPDSLQKALK